MKNGGKLWVIGLWVFFLVCAGYYLVYSNLNAILTSEKRVFKLTDGLKFNVITSGQWRENLTYKVPLGIQRYSRGWLVRNRHGTLEIITSPSLRIRWKKPTGQGG